MRTLKPVDITEPCFLNMIRGIISRGTSGKPSKHFLGVSVRDPITGQRKSIDKDDVLTDEELIKFFKPFSVEFMDRKEIGNSVALAFIDILEIRKYPFWFLPSVKHNLVGFYKEHGGFESKVVLNVKGEFLKYSKRVFGDHNGYWKTVECVLFEYCKKEGYLNLTTFLENS